MVKADTELDRKFKIVLKILGIGLLTAVTVVAEFGGFEAFSNYKAVISFVGYDVVENQSGKHSGKSKISKKGNSRIRRVLFMPAFSAVKHGNGQLKNLYDRIQLKNGDKLKMKAYVAVQKKLLTYIYYAWTKEIDYSKAIIQKEEQVTASPLDNIAAFEKNKAMEIPKMAKKEIDYSEAIIQKVKQVTTLELDNIAEFKKNKNMESTIKKEKSSHISVAAQGSNPVSYHSITPHRYNKIT